MGRGKNPAKMPPLEMGLQRLSGGMSLRSQSSSMLSDVPPRVLAELCRAHGREHLLEQGRCRAMLADVCGGYHTEVFLLDCVVRERLVKAVLSVGMPVEFAVSQLASQIGQALRVDPEAARWAAEAWATAMEWTSEGHAIGKTLPKDNKNLAGGTCAAGHTQRILVEGIVRAFRGALGDVGLGTNADKTLIDAVFGVGEGNDRDRGSAEPWATVKFLTFTRQARGLVFTDQALHFVNPAAAADRRSGSWTFARLQEVGARRQGLQEIGLADGDDRMSLEGTGISVSTMLLFLDLLREVVGPFLVDRALPEPLPRPGEKPAPRKRAKR